MRYSVTSSTIHVTIDIVGNCFSCGLIIIFFSFWASEWKFQTTASLHSYRVPHVSFVDIYGSSEKRKHTQKTHTHTQKKEKEKKGLKKKNP